MELAVSLLACAAFIAVWIVINRRFKKTNKPFLLRHIAGAFGGAIGLTIVVVIAQATGLIDTVEQATPTQVAATDDKHVLSGIPKNLNFRELMDHHLNDFTEEDGTLIIESESPLKITLYPSAVIEQTDEVKTSDMQRAVLYGIYKTFVHTNEPQIDVTAHMIEIESYNPYKAEKNHSLEVNISVTREQALEAVKAFIPSVNSFDDLVTTRTYGDITAHDEWTPEFEQLYFEREDQAKLLDALRKTAY